MHCRRHDAWLLRLISKGGYSPFSQGMEARKSTSNYRKVPGIRLFKQPSEASLNPEGPPWRKPRDARHHCPAYRDTIVGVVNVRSFLTQHCVTRLRKLRTSCNGRGLADYCYATSPQRVSAASSHRLILGGWTAATPTRWRHGMSDL